MDIIDGAEGFEFKVKQPPLNPTSEENDYASYLSVDGGLLMSYMLENYIPNGDSNAAQALPPASRSSLLIVN
ncbi:hypothetical protein KC19_8G065500 [Ceratodon purpureus]|uniref:Uncharacterized protein n=1 Tax=Ceratodon purpureus TaxID=3225 RepID=A0A8T0GYB4_CERPU|nr:hypothetical protein KC19_8G065500 [Ceratodon purpureus]